MTYAADPQQRDQILDDARKLLDWLEAHPDLPITATGIEVSLSISEDTDDAETEELQRIAAAAGVDITNVRGKTAGPDDTHRYAVYQIGKVRYRAAAVAAATMAAHDEHVANCRYGVAS